MQKKLINDTKMLRMIDGGSTQADVARCFGVTPGAVHSRLRTLRGRTTYAVAATKVEKAIDSKLDVVEQLKTINQTAQDLLANVEEDAHLSVKLMAEIRNQLRLMMDVYEMLYSLEGAAQFQQSVLEVLEDCDPQLRKDVVAKLNEKSSLRAALRFK